MSSMLSVNQMYFLKFSLKSSLPTLHLAKIPLTSFLNLFNFNLLLFLGISVLPRNLIYLKFLYWKLGAKTSFPSQIWLSLWLPQGHILCYSNHTLLFFTIEVPKCYHKDSLLARYKNTIIVSSASQPLLINYQNVSLSSLNRG